MVDRFEGSRIRSITQCNLPIVNLLFESSGEGDFTRYRMEDVDVESLILQKARYSSDLAMILLPSAKLDSCASIPQNVKTAEG